VATEAKEHEEKSHSARYLILIFLVCVATCGVFFSLGFLVGYNERASRSVPSTEVVTPPPVIPPAVNPPPESAPVTPGESAPGQPPPISTPETVVIPPGGDAANATATAAKPAAVAHPAGQPQAASKHGSNPPPPPTPAAGEVGVGLTLQVVAVGNKHDAEHVVDILKEKGYPVFLATPEYAHVNDNLFRVLVGPFRTRADADKMHDKLVQEGFKKPFIRH
jgi:cell division septation protein DedD